MLASAPLNIVRRFGEEMFRLFEDFGVTRDLVSPGWREVRSFGAELGRADWAPRVDVFERDGRLVVRADLPGVSKDAINVEMRGDCLIIQGETRNEREHVSQGVYRSERNRGTFYRSIPLPDGVDVEGAEATFRDGVLQVAMAMPRPADHQGRRLEIRDVA